MSTTDQAPPVRKALATILESSAAPYGYTLTIWSAGAMLMHFRGSPRVWMVFIFLAGALAGFTLLGTVGARVARRVEPLGPGVGRLVAGMMDWVAVALAVGAATLLAKIQSWVAWPCASFAATIIYLGVASIQLALAVGVDS